jgi:hypothetical protein
VPSWIVLYAGAVILGAFHKGKDTELNSQCETIMYSYGAKAFELCDLNQDILRSSNGRKGEKKLKVKICGCVSKKIFVCLPLPGILRITQNLAMVLKLGIIV